MSYDYNVYYNPERFGLTVVAAADIADSYEFDTFVIWTDGKHLFWATDSGCSCPEPFERFASIADLEAGTFKECRAAINSWGSDSWRGAGTVMAAHDRLISAISDWHIAKKGSK